MRYTRKRHTYKSQNGGFSALLRNLGKVSAKIIDKVAPKIIKYAARPLAQVVSHTARGVAKVGKTIVHGQPKGWNKYAGASSNAIARNKQDLIPNYKRIFSLIEPAMLSYAVAIRKPKKPILS